MNKSLNIPQAISTKKIAEKIENIKKQKMLQEKVVKLKDFKETQRIQHHILVVDDDETMRLALKRIFETQGFKVVLAGDATELLEVLEVYPFELILLDIKLPWVDGYELCRLLKQHDYLKDIPIVFISGKDSELDIKRGFEAGADDYIIKPFDVDEITETVKTLLKLK